MPWTAKQLKLFRAAAHNPAIAKSSGIKQADAERMSKEGLKKMAGGGRAVINKQDTKHGKMDMPFNKLNRFAGMKAGGMMKGVDKNLPTGKQMGNLNMKSGGMKESKAMVGKEVAFMKKKGAPKSMIRHEAAEMGAMKKGGMAKYARGGGIESKGKTKGTIIKMAAGGLAGGHKAADGIAQRGKTKGMKVSMKGGGYC
jgi:hypothetical protein